MTEYFLGIFHAKFLHPEAWWLLFPAAIAVIASALGKRVRAGALLLRILTLLLIITALADPVRRQTSEKEELVALLDVSASVLPAAREAMLEQLRDFTAQGADLTVYPFAKSLAREGVSVVSSPVLTGERFESAAEKLDQGETNIGLALGSVLSRSRSASILLMSDGFETAGNAAQVAQAAAQQGVRVFPLVPGEDAFTRERLRISSLYAPVTAHAGDIVEARASVQNLFNEEARGKLELWLDSEKLFSQIVAVPAGQEKLITVKTSPAKGGLHKVRAVFRPERLTGKEEKDNGIEEHRWVAVKEKAKILLISGTNDDARILKQLITQKGYSLEDIVADGSKELPDNFEGYSSVIINNAAKRQIPDRFFTALDAFVKDGGGLLLVGGERSYGLGGYIDTKLEEMSPLKFVPPQTEKRRLTNAIALVIDKSGSMAEDNKIGATKLAALAVIQSLKDEDYVSVIGFDAGPFVIIDVQRVAEAKHEAERRLRNLTAAGKTNLLPALATARQRLQKAGTSRKHIIVLSDGKFPLSSEAYIGEINNLRNDGISVSTVALGVEADIPFMKILAKYGKGAFYHTLDPSQLPRIFVEDVKVASGEKTLKEGVDLPVGVGPAGVRSTRVKDYPPIRGFVETLPKRGSELELITRTEERAQPLLASWSYGAGRVIAFTSDANGRWSLPWIRWSDFTVFWGQIIEGIKDRSGSKSGEVDFDLRYSVERKNVVFDLAVYDEKLRTESAPRISADVIEPGGERRQLVFQTTRKGRFEARIENGRPGDYKIEISYGKTKLPALAAFLGGELFGEIPGQGVNIPVLENMAFATSGKINPAPEDVQGISRTSENEEHLFVPLALLAFILVLLEAFLRERGIFLPSAVPRRKNVSPPKKRYNGSWSSESSRS